MKKDSVSEVNESDDEYVSVSKKRDQKPFNKKELSDFIRDTGVSKDVGEFMASVLISRGLAQPRTKSSIYREREKEFRKYFFDTPCGKFVFPHAQQKTYAQNLTFHTSYQKVLYNTRSGKRFSSRVPFHPRFARV